MNEKDYIWDKEIKLSNNAINYLIHCLNNNYPENPERELHNTLVDMLELLEMNLNGQKNLKQPAR